MCVRKRERHRSARACERAREIEREREIEEEIHNFLIGY